jgi:hypothetical protein
MDLLERLRQDEDGVLFHADGRAVDHRRAYLRGKIGILVVQNICLNISSAIDNLTRMGSSLIPKNANAYVASDFSADGQFLRGEGDQRKVYSVYAIQFYFIYHAD